MNATVKYMSKGSLRFASIPHGSLRVLYVQKQMLSLSSQSMHNNQLLRQSCSITRSQSGAAAATDDFDYPLTTEEAVYFLENKLNIPHHEKLMKEDKLALLNLIILRMRSIMPFTNIPIVSQRKQGNGYPLPSFQEMKEDMYSCRGGACLWVNSFTTAMLNRIGFKTSFVGATIPAQSPLEGVHMGTLVYNVTRPGSVHLVDAGNKRPIFQAIPLDFVGESNPIHFGGTVTKFIDKGGGIIHDCMLLANGQDSTEENETKPIGNANDWMIMHAYNIAVPKSLSHFAKMAAMAIGESTLFPGVHHDLHVFGYPDGKFVSITNWTLSILSKDGHKIRRQIDGPEDLIQVIKKYFPTTSRNKIEIAIKNVYSM